MMKHTVYGRDGDKEKILEFLFKNDNDDAEIGVIPIIGMGGLGKTTLAKHVYNDDSLSSNFGVKAWVCVSDVFDIMRITKGILESITSKNSDLKELSQVQLQLKTELAGKKFVLVLDDVWTKNYDNWHALYTPLMSGAPGSKIIVTTRDADVAKMMGAHDYFELKKMCEDDCWMLFKKHAFGNSSVEHPDLEKIGRQIVSKRCDGLPLAARSLGGLLRLKESPDKWEEVLNSNMWSLFGSRSNILPALELSYYYLPSHLKRCFAYCAILPKDFEFEEEEIILLWMAEGLISQAKDKREMEDLGGDYFRELLSRSIFQTSSANRSRFVMHDLVNDLAQKVAGDVCLRLDEEISVGEEFQPERVRHTSYMKADVDGSKRFASFHNMQRLRTFLPLSRLAWKDSYLASCVPNELVKDLKCLRVLSFRGYMIEELPNSIGDLKHLRYLDVSDTKIKILPESTSSLCNLQTLILRGCHNLKKLPVRMDNLINLRHLDLRGVRLIEWTPTQIKELGNLKTLIDIVIDNEFFPLSHLLSLKSLRGELSLRNLSTVDVSDAMKAKLKNKEGVRDLELWWRGVFRGTEVEDGGADSKRVLDGLQPHKNIEKLLVDNYGGSEFPSWIGDPTFNNIVKVQLEDCHKCTLLPPLGMLPNLKELYIERMSSLEKVNKEFYGNNCSNSFPCLEVLNFEEMDNLKEWNGFEFEFRVLQKFTIRRCKNLAAALPSLPMVLELNIRSCKEVDFKSIVDFNSLNKIELFEISRIKNLAAKGFVQRLKKFKLLAVSDSESWGVHWDRGCEIVKCPQLMGMVVGEEKEQLQMEIARGELESLRLINVKLPTWIQKAVLLRKLTIHNCESLISLGRRQIPPTLMELHVVISKNLKRLLDEEDEAETSSSINLEILEINCCESLTSISSTGELPATLKDLSICNCENLTSISPAWELPAALKHLNIHYCEKIESMTKGFDTNTSLETFFVSSCSNLRFLPEGLHNLIKLSDFRLYNCPYIVSFPKGGLPNTCLANLAIEKLEKLEALPDNLHALSSLQKLIITDCPNLMSFPSEGFPSNLTSLEISSKHLFECGLERLNSLEELCIYGGIGERRRVLWDKTKTMLLPSLTTLEIRDFPNLKYISSRGFHHLRSLTMSQCPKLAFFRKNDLPDSLECLKIEYCPKLASFPKSGLPDSMLELEVHDCPRIEGRCQEGKRPELSKILHIPKVHIH